MSLYKFTSFATAPNKMMQKQRAVVYDNNDELKMGRVRVNIPGIFDEADNGKHPWIYVRSSHEHNGNEKEAQISIPRIGATVNVDFHGGSPYHGTYSDTYRNQNNVNNTPFENNYPNVYGTVDRSGNSHIHDMVEGTNTYTHVAQTDNENTDDVSENDEGTAPSTGTSFAAPNPSSKIKEKVDAGAVAKMIHQIIADGSISTKSQGNHTTNIAQDSSHTTGGDASHNVTGSMNINSIKDMLMKTLQDLTHSASGNIAHSAGSDIIHKAEKIFLN